MNILAPRQIEEAKKILYYLKHTEDTELSFLKVYRIGRIARKKINKNKQEIINKLEEDIKISEKLFTILSLIDKYEKQS